MPVKCLKQYTELDRDQEAGTPGALGSVPESWGLNRKGLAAALAGGLSVAGSRGGWEQVSLHSPAEQVRDGPQPREPAWGGGAFTSPTGHSVGGGDRKSLGDTFSWHFYAQTPSSHLGRGFQSSSPVA